MSDIRLAHEARDVLGEGPAWDARAQRLYWVDIKGGRLRWLHPQSGASGSVAVEGQISAVWRPEPAGTACSRPAGTAWASSIRKPAPSAIASIRSLTGR